MSRNATKTALERRHFKVKGDLFDDVAIRTNGASSGVKQLEFNRQVKKPLEINTRNGERRKNKVRTHMMTSSC